MTEFARYYVTFLRELFSNIWDFIKTLFSAFANLLYYDIKDYFDILVNVSNGFNILDWIVFVFVLIINVAFITLIIIRIAQAARRHHKNRKKDAEKAELLEEIAGLNYKVEELINEKNQLFAMKVSSLGLRTNGTVPVEGGGSSIERGGKPGEDKKLKAGESRFVKLMNVDKDYNKVAIITNMGEADMVNLPELVDRFVNFSASQLHLYYEKKLIAIWFAGLATSKILILEGISGTGKTSLPYAMGKFFQNDAAIVSVQPSWRDRAEIIGYLNEFTKRFNETDFLKALYETTYRDDINIIILDEMNLARIEYYFAEFLSIMEMPDVNEWKIDIVPDSLSTDPVNIVNGKLLVPQNVWFVGTANKDDSTFTITDKVYDRATVLEMNTKAKYIDAAFTPAINMTYEYLDNLFKKALEEHPLSSKSLDNLTKVDKFIASNFKITFGNRILKQIRIFVPVFVACGFSETEAIDYFLAYKIIRKFESLNLSFLHNELNELISVLDKIYGKGACEECISCIKDFIKNS